ncbi:MAG TPA: SURF1 family cytochrome oxidase biogenesis protein [Thermomicrobiales bacterium]|nr:SURF1 family cytochrome oxidase biogenesis protein [Thermomicrobiales bacterium]
MAIDNETAAPPAADAGLPGLPDASDFPEPREPFDWRAALAGRLRRARKLVRGWWLLLTIVVLLGVAIMVGLGYWQMGRLYGRRQVNAMIQERRAEPPLTIAAANARSLDSATMSDRQVTVTGTWDYAHEVLLRNRAYYGSTGYDLLTPLRVDGGDTAIMVDRGWIPYDKATPADLLGYRHGDRGTASGLVHIAAPPQSRGTMPRPLAAGATAAHQDAFFGVDLGAIQRQTPYQLLPFWVEQAASTGQGTQALPIPDPDLTLDDGPHFGYMIQWWAFALTLLVGYVAMATQDTSRWRRAEGDD